MYTSACIEEARIGSNLSYTDIKDGSHSHTWNNEDHAFACQLDQWGVEKFFLLKNDCYRRMRIVYILSKQSNRQYRCIHKHNHQ